MAAPENSSSVPERLLIPSAIEEAQFTPLARAIRLAMPVSSATMRMFW